MNSTHALGKFQAILQSDKNTVNFCGSELRWIENRKQDWASDHIRVGVIGVTSSGKSTLINAILGTDILSSAIAPSSGQLVCCSYGETSEIIIHFANGSSRTLSGKKFSREDLQQFSDERYNPRNSKDVLSIELTSPLFDFGKDVLLVDSPGLDAFGLEAHERLTLESLVPTIDACIYVTTMKTNGDRKTQEILNTVAKYNCPIIIVQNMLDAVRPSPSGDKTSEQVARDHKNRVQKIIDSSDISDKASVQIIQISAEIAKRWRAAKSEGKDPVVNEEEYKKSNYDDFVQSVTEILEVQRPRIERQRLISIRSSANDVCLSASGKINKPVTAVEDKFPLEALKTRAINHQKSIQSRYQAILDSYEKSVKEIRVTIGVDKDSNNVVQSRKGLSGFLFRFDTSSNNLEDSLRITNETVQAFSEALANLISEHNSFVIAAAEKINIPSRDLLCSSSLHSFHAVSLEKKITTGSRRVKKEGLGGGVARFFGKINPFSNDWGYEYETYEDVVTDVEKTKQKICERLSDAYKRYTKSMTDWFTDNFMRSMDIICKQISDAEESYEIKKATIVETESLVQLVAALKSFICEIDACVPCAKFSTAKEEALARQTTTEIEVDPYIGSILSLSRTALQLQHRKVAKSFVSQIKCESHVPILIEWDESCKENFFWQTGISDAKIIHAPSDGSQIPQGGKKCVFILVNAIQFGAALKQISSLCLSEALSKQDYVVWVVQDFQELLTCDQAAECLSQMRELPNVLKIPCKSSIYLLHENPLYNIASLKFQFDRSYQLAPHRLMDELQTTYRVYSSPKVEKALGKCFTKHT